MTAPQSACTPALSAVASARSIRLERQSTSVPNTSNSRTRIGFTAVSMPTSPGEARVIVVRPSAAGDGSVRADAEPDGHREAGDADENPEPASWQAAYERRADPPAYQEASGKRQRCCPPHRPEDCEADPGD